jgi:glycosyltransferase involved in cell wall biosynthesis
MEPTKKILFLVAHRPGRSPGQRFRFEQYLNYLTNNGFDCKVSFLINEKDDKTFYATGKYFQKSIFVFKSIFSRLKDLRQIDNFDIIFLYREAHFLGTTWFERKIKEKGKIMIVDFDDSIWLKDISNGNKNLAFLKYPQKTEKIIKICHTIIVGNQFLADYASRFNPNVHIIPTTIDTTYYKPNISDQFYKKPICIGWTGSSTTLKHFALAVPFLKNIRKKYGDSVTFRLISDEFFDVELPGLEKIKWSKDTEVEDLSAIDIGIMPLPNDEWSRGKCGFKGLQYMALGKATVMSPVGVNTEIIQHGINGYLASTQAEWEDILSKLIENPNERKEIGLKGRETVEEKFSNHSQKDRYLAIFNNLLSEKT